MQCDTCYSVHHDPSKFKSIPASDDVGGTWHICPECAANLLPPDAANEKEWQECECCEGNGGRWAVSNPTLPTSSERIAALLSKYMRTDGAHHKQWLLEQIADVVGVKHDNEGIAP